MNATISGLLFFLIAYVSFVCVFGSWCCFKLGLFNKTCGGVHFFPALLVVALRAEGEIFLPSLANKGRHFLKDRAWHAEIR